MSTAAPFGNVPPPVFVTWVFATVLLATPTARITPAISLGIGFMRSSRRDSTENPAACNLEVENAAAIYKKTRCRFPPRFIRPVPDRHHSIAQMLRDAGTREARSSP